MNLYFETDAMVYCRMCGKTLRMYRKGQNRLSAIPVDDCKCGSVSFGCKLTMAFTIMGYMMPKEPAPLIEKVKELAGDVDIQVIGMSGKVVEDQYHYGIVLCGEAPSVFAATLSVLLGANRFRSEDQTWVGFDDWTF